MPYAPQYRSKSLIPLAVVVPNDKVGLAQYVNQGVDELDQEKLAPLLRLRYGDSLPDAFADLGGPERVRAVFLGVQRRLYELGRARLPD